MHMLLATQIATVFMILIYLNTQGLDLANAEYPAGVNLNREIRMCGPILTNTLELVCQGRFNTVQKRGQDGNARPREWANNDRENFALFPFRTRRNAPAGNNAGARTGSGVGAAAGAAAGSRPKAGAGAGPFRRRTRNVADECCYLKPCTLAEMSHYCERN